MTRVCSNRSQKPMEDWHDYVSVIGESFVVASIVASVACAAISGVLRALGAVGFRPHSSWRGDLRPLRWVAPVALVLIFVPGVLLGFLLSGACGTSSVTEFPAPDSNHRLAVYGFDCGATTDFSLVVSLLGARDRLPKHRTVSPLYSSYHQEPVASGSGSNFEVHWQDAHHALVKIEGFTGKPSAQRDGVSVRFEQLR